MNAIGRAFQPTGATVNEAVTGSAETVSIAARLPDVDGAVRIANIGTVTIFITLDGTTAAVATGIPILANTVECFSMPQGKVAIKHIASGAGSTIYVTPGRGV
jgi:hypothetical protein